MAERPVVGEVGLRVREYLASQRHGVLRVAASAGHGEVAQLPSDRLLDLNPVSPQELKERPEESEFLEGESDSGSSGRRAFPKKQNP